MKIPNHIKSLAGLSDNFNAFISSYFTKKKIRAGEFLFKEGEISNNIYFLEEGLLRLYYYTDAGKDITAWFTIEQNFVSATNSPYLNRPVREYCEALEDCVVYEIKFSDFEKLLDHPEGAKMAFYALSELNRSLSRYLHFLKFHSAEERYKVLLEYSPNIVHRASLGHISTFLGISQETLSRIRSRI